MNIVIEKYYKHCIRYEKLIQNEIDYILEKKLMKGDSDIDQIQSN